MEEKKERKKILVVLGVFTLLLALAVGGVYAYFAARAENSGSQITGRTLDINGATLSIAATRVNLVPNPAPEGYTAPVSDNLVPANFGIPVSSMTTTEVNRALDNYCAGGGYTGCHVWKIQATSTVDIPTANIKLNLRVDDIPVEEEEQGEGLSNPYNPTGAVASPLDYKEDDEYNAKLLAHAQDPGFGNAYNQWSYIVYTGTDSSATTILNKGSITTTFLDTNTTIDIHSGASLTANTPVVYYVMVYLNNVNSAQNDGVTTGTTDATGIYNGTVILEAMGGKVRVDFIERATDVSYFRYDIVDRATYTVSDQSACESYLVQNFYWHSDGATTLCSGGSYNYITLEDYIVEGEIPSSDYATAGLSDVTIAVENREVLISDYKLGASVYTVSNQSACTNYVEDILLGWDYSSSDSSTYATALCTGGSDNHGYTLEDYIVEGEIPSSDYATAGLSNVTVTQAPTQVVIPNTIEGYPVTIIGEAAFEDRGLTSVVIPSSITLIKLNAFIGNSLTTVEIPSSVTTIEDRAFFNNPLISITIGNQSVTIESCAFGSNPPLSEPFASNYSCN